MKQTALKTAGICLASVLGTQAIANPECDATGNLTIVSAVDDGLYEETHGPENSIEPSVPENAA